MSVKIPYVNQTNLSSFVLMPGSANWINMLREQQVNVGLSKATAGKVDGAGNLYVSAIIYNASNFDYDCLIAKYNREGTVQWLTQVQDIPAVEYQVNDIALDSGGSVYVTGKRTSINAAHTIKLNNNGAIQWQRTIYDPLGSNVDAQSIAIDTLNNIYVLCTSDYNGSDDIYFAKIDSNGNILFQRYMGNAGIDVAFDIATDNSNNVYTIGYATYGNVECQISKWNSLGTIQWQRRLGAFFVTVGAGIAVDSTGNVYVTGYYQLGLIGNMFVAKYNTSGVIQWQQTLTELTSVFGTKVAVDTANNVYALGSKASRGKYLIAKYDTNGALIWQRQLVMPYTSGTEVRNITVDNAGFYYVFGSMEVEFGYSQTFIIKLPVDGSQKGCFTVLGQSGPPFTLPLGLEVTYETANVTNAAGTLVDAVGTLATGLQTLTFSSVILPTIASPQQSYTTFV